MSYNLKESLKIVEETTSLYLKYIEIYGKDWSEQEMNISKETLGTLTIFCHQLINFTEMEKDVLDTKTKEVMEKYIPQVQLFCSQITQILYPLLSE